jgi:hypothetical protein
MDLLLKIAPFLVFVVVYLGYIALQFIGSTQLAQPYPSNRSWFFAYELVLMTPILFLLVTMYLLAGDFVPYILLLYFLVGQIGALVIVFMGGPNSTWQLVQKWHTVWLSTRKPWQVLPMALPAALMLVLYPIAVGFVYFSHVRPSDSMSLLVFQWTLLIVYGVSAPWTVFIAASTIGSTSIDEPTRLRALTAYMASTLSTALTVTLLLWSLRVPGVGTNFSFGSVSLLFAPQLAVIVAAYLVLTLVVPYAVGAQRSKARRLAYMRKQGDFLNDAREAVALPDSERRAGELAALASSLENRIQELSQDAPDPAPAAMVSPDEGQESSSNANGSGEATATGNPAAALFALPGLAQAYRASQMHDPRVAHQMWLKELKLDVQDAERDLSVSNKRGYSRMAQDWLTSFSVKQDRVTEQVHQAGDAGTLIGFLVVSVVGPLSSAVFITGFGGWLWKTFESTALR